MLHALIDTAASSVIRYAELSEPPQLAPEKGLAWLPVADTRPEPGPGETLAGPVVTVTAVAVVRVWSVAPLVPPVPASVTMLQARLALRRAGLFDAVQAAIDSLADPEAHDAWEYATTVSRGGALVTAVTAALGLTAQQVDDLFRAAALIEA